MPVRKTPAWVTRGKTIRQLIEELQTFSDQSLEVKISIDGGESFKCISIVGRQNSETGHFCGLVNSEGVPNEDREHT